MMNKNKTGIITFNKAHNYGAVMQAYALQYKLNSLGYDVSFINSNNEIDKKYRLIPDYKKLGVKNFIRYIVRLILNYNRITKRYIGFHNFIKKYLSSIDITENKFEFKNVVLGSDQIWNPNITKGYDPIYFGIHPNLVCDNVISYAGSMGNGMEDKNFNNEFLSKLNTLKAIGVREPSLAEAIENHFSLEPVINLDPTLLLNKEEWAQVTSEKYNNEKYILVYEVEKNKLTPDVLDLLKNRFNLSVKVISSKISMSVPKDYVTTASPEDFLSLFLNATFVVTSSFHGTVFSIINNKPFYTMKFNNGVDLRSAGLLKSVGLSDRHIDSLEQATLEDIDFSIVETKLNDLREKSVDYLTSSLV
ncbi:polysaccharide pyruvyl transferase family protein [Vibrio viridaestus]|nr:polysaccharide pyruvyl transferase family protein [Vibrio viridaestus]